jgi:hypothetical protein
LLLLLLQLLLPKLHCAELLPLLLLLRLPPFLHPKWCSDFAMAAVTACSLSKSTAVFVAASSFSSSKLPVSRPFVVAVKTSSSFSLQERRLCRLSSSSSQGLVVPSVSSSLNHSCLSRKAHLRGFFLLVVLGLLHLFVECFWIVFEKLLHLKVTNMAMF